ncbi:uncharacterized protein K02A2.6-like [Uranotaenia lowii]|uniref:uncharacterized protein K02A2.6-like n=1 Tax=Uranotaenia lowii TaxID=190385 RepID=UPI00247917C9|nr:uncharacterized protein K02A2.6-like [Uranotaenia lowii]
MADFRQFFDPVAASSLTSPFFRPIPILDSLRPFRRITPLPSGWCLGVLGRLRRRAASPQIKRLLGTFNGIANKRSTTTDTTNRALVTKSTSFLNTRKVLDDVFEKEGFPKNIKSDNGPPFNSDDYQQYCKERGINVLYSTPLYPQQNGLAESCMKLVNKAMAAAHANGSNYVDELNAAVKAYNAAFHSVTKVPPEEVMTGRKIKRNLPLLRRGRAIIDDELLNARDRESKIKSKEREDLKRGARTCRVQPGDMVIVERNIRMKGDSRFDPRKFTVVKENNGNLLLNDEHGQLLKRHVSQTKKVHNWRESLEPAGSIKRQHNTKAEQLQTSGPISPTDIVRRSTRVKHSPVFLKGYVQSLQSSSQIE